MTVFPQNTREKNCRFTPGIDFDRIAKTLFILEFMEIKGGDLQKCK